ncbi:MAG: hypothetical protein A3I73_03645 [Omnitrophica bacterium RIFCSPLOWO2_02_FULL_45_16]|nr:MAG: hypothetical protein A3C51_04840 [Omnitrophica bacterium RIFCSPHIGHO2_02_FULL_46_20]OGW93618.1 MAG: hypothetical protein A3K16_00790 [Omnitrophica bacterium RIFCSPLOWO2_01_FULL_45_24]OGX01525.1 MAG: hypothetical protein A3I73_03645 [Omnitrophica bacterium RIFCSPLOWO2_02_FULL_45_16]
MENELAAWQELHRFYKYSSYLTKDLAAYLKVSPRTIQRWSKGQTRPNQKELNLIMKYLRENSKKETQD